MAKRKRERVAAEGQEELQPEPARLLRKSARLLEKAQSAKEDEYGSDESKRSKAPLLDNGKQREEGEIPEQTAEVLGVAQTQSYNPVAHWALTSSWPKDMVEKGVGLSDSPSSKKRKSDESTDPSETRRRLAAHGVEMNAVDLLQREDKALYEGYLSGSRSTVRTSIFTADQFTSVLDRVRDANEDRVKKSVLPWIVPSAEDLFFLQELAFEYIGEEFNTLWTKCGLLGSMRPKPDYTTGLLAIAFSTDEMLKLENYARPDQPIRVTATLLFPFLTCEVKAGSVGLNKAELQNIHSASIAVRAIIMLYREVFTSTDPGRVEALYGTTLAFSVSHDNDKILIHGHYAVAAAGLPDGLKYTSYLMALLSLSAHGGRDKYLSYNFVSNIYERFVPNHLQRIKDAIAHLPSPAPRIGLTQLESGVATSESEGQQDQQKPGNEGASAEETVKLRTQLERLLQQQEQLLNENRQLREEHKQEMEQQQERMEVQLQALRDVGKSPRSIKTMRSQRRRRIMCNRRSVKM